MHTISPARQRYRHQLEIRGLSHDCASRILSTIFRLFFFDNRHGFILIVASVLLPIFVTFLGYLYHRFQSRIEGIMAGSYTG